MLKEHIILHTYVLISSFLRSAEVVQVWVSVCVSSDGVWCMP